MRGRAIQRTIATLLCATARMRSPCSFTAVSNVDNQYIAINNLFHNICIYFDICQTHFFYRFICQGLLSNTKGLHRSNRKRNTPRNREYFFVLYNSALKSGHRFEKKNKKGIQIPESPAKESSLLCEPKYTELMFMTICT